MPASGFLKQSTTDTIKMGPFLDATDGVTEETGITPVVEISKDNGAFGARNSATSITHDAEGYFNVELNATDTNTVGRLIAKAHDSATHLPVWHEFWVLEESIFDSLFAASAAGFDSNQRVDVGSWLGTAVTTSATTAKPQVDVDSIDDDATAANNLELDYDGTGYNKSASTIGTATSVTNQVTADVTAISGDSTAADNLEAEFDGTGYKSYLRRNTAQAGAAGTITLDASANATDDYYNGTIVALLGGTGAGQARIITDYTGSSKIANVSPNWVTNPDATSVFIIVPGSINVSTWSNAVVNALVSGRVDSSVGAMASAVLTASAIATDAIGSAEFSQAAADKIWDSATRTLTALGFNLANTDFAAGAIDANAIAADAIGASELATDAVNEIVDQVWNEALSGHTTLGSIGQVLNALGARTGAVNDAGPLAGDFDVDGFTETTDDHFNGMKMIFTSGALTGQSRIITDYTGSGQNMVFADAWTEAPANNDEFVIIPTGISDVRLVNEAVINALVSGRVDSSVGNMEAGVLTATAIASAAITAAKFAAGAIDANALATDAVNEIVDQTWDEDIEAAHGTDATAGFLLRILGAAISNRTNNSTLNDLLGVTDAAGADVPSQTTDEVWDELVSAHTTAGSFGEQAQLGVFGNINDAGPTATDFDGNSGLSTSDDFYNGSVLVFLDGTLAGIARRIVDYTGASRNIDFTGQGFPTAPSNGDRFLILGRIEP